MPPSFDRGVERALIVRYQATLRGEGEMDPALADELGQMFNAHWEWVHTLCCRFVGDTDRADELTQDVMVTAWRRLGDFEGRSRFSTWLYTMARQVSWRAVAKRAEFLTEDGVLDAEDALVSTLKVLRRRERAEFVREAAAELDDLEQEAIYLRYVEMLPYDAINATLGLQTASGARGLLQRCKRKLRKKMRARLEELGVSASFLRSSI